MECATCDTEKQYALNCDKTPGREVLVLAGGIGEMIPYCPEIWLQEHRGYLNAWRYYNMLNQGIPPRAGGADEQPQTIMDSIAIISDEATRIRFWNANHPAKAK